MGSPHSGPFFTDLTRPMLRCSILLAARGVDLPAGRGLACSCLLPISVLMRSA